jgi:hypothetical protein
MLPESAKDQVVAINKTTSITSLTTATPGGSAALYLQHRATGSGNALVCGVRSQMQSDQSNGTVIGGAFGMLHTGSTVGYGLWSDVYHAGSASLTVGVAVDMARQTLGGQLVGMRIAGAECDIGLDLSQLAVSKEAAIKVRNGQRVTIGNYSLIGNPVTGSIEMHQNFTPKVAIDGGQLFLTDDMTLHLANPGFRAPAEPIGAPAYFRIRLNHGDFWVPFYA